MANSALRASLAIYLLNISISIFDRKRLLSLQAYFAVWRHTSCYLKADTAKKNRSFYSSLWSWWLPLEDKITIDYFLNSSNWFLFNRRMSAALKSVCVAVITHLVFSLSHVSRLHKHRNTKIMAHKDKGRYKCHNQTNSVENLFFFGVIVPTRAHGIYIGLGKHIFFSI